MPRAPDAPAAAAHARPPLTTRGLKPADINPDEMDDVIMRIFTELKRQLELLEKAEPKDLKDVAVREKHARILASLESTMERLAKVEAGRAAARKNTASMTHEQKRDLLLRKLTVQATLERAGEDSGAHG